jgi:hypothetical protein
MGLNLFIGQLPQRFSMGVRACGPRCHKFGIPFIPSDDNQGSGRRLLIPRLLDRDCYPEPFIHPETPLAAYHPHRAMTWFR